MKPAQKRIGLSIDLGYGQVKLSRRAKSGQIEYLHFPSLAVAAEPSAMRGLNSRTRDTFDVPTSDGGLYEVGKDVVLAQTGNDFGREITDSWANSPIYEALMKGALRYQDEAHIDLLVLGLPVNLFLVEHRREELVAKYQSKSIDLGGGKSVSIDRILVRPQPLGGYLELANHLDLINTAISSKSTALPPLESAGDLADICMLVVDPGENTLDWLLIEKGQINTKASGATSDAGRHRIIRAVAESMAAKIGRPIAASNLPRIDESLRLNLPFKMSGVAYDLNDFSETIKSTVQDPINRLIEGLKGLEDRIELIGVVGGHPEMYRKELDKRFPFVPVFVSPMSLFANLRGFQVVADEVLARDSVPA